MSLTQTIALAAAILASGLIVISFFMKTMIPLRWLAVGSNVGFIVYGVLDRSMGTLALHLSLLPVNIYRAIEMTRLTRQVNAAASGADLSGLWLRPYMKTNHFKKGHTLFRKGDAADHLYLLLHGRLEFVEIQRDVTPGQVFGEIAFFSPERQRSLTAVCLEDCTLLSIDEFTVKQLFYQNPEFAFELVTLITSRLSTDVRRLESTLAVGATRQA